MVCRVGSARFVVQRFACQNFGCTYYCFESRGVQVLSITNEPLSDSDTRPHYATCFTCMPAFSIVSLCRIALVSYHTGRLKTFRCPRGKQRDATYVRLSCDVLVYMSSCGSVLMRATDGDDICAEFCSIAKRGQ